MDRFLYCFLNSRKRFNILQKCSLTLGRNKFKRSKLCQFQIYCRLKRNKIKHQIIVIPFNHLIRQKQIIVKITEILRKNKKKKNREEKSIDSFKKKEKNRPQNLKNVPALSATFPRLPSTTVSTHRRTALFPRECSSKRASEQARGREREKTIPGDFASVRLRGKFCWKPATGIRLREVPSSRRRTSQPGEI